MKHIGNHILIADGLAALFVLFPLVTTQAAALPSEQIELAHHRLMVEIAATPEQWASGLMFRTRMAADRGMLFLFPSTAPRMFWMKNTLIPLDILFFDSQRRLINVSADTPPCKRDPCPLYASRAPAQYVLELNAGITARLKLRSGDVLTIGR